MLTFFGVLILPTSYIHAQLHLPHGIIRLENGCYILRAGYINVHNGFICNLLLL